ncbi:MAG TPA: LCP family protein [Clostridia bacterium]|nr:LCP family protein [Clostridia bacterium]HUM60974.1 LCP family protein [Clostridia bacterium]
MKQHVKKPGTKLKAVCVLLIAVAILLGLYRGGRWLETRRNNPEPRGNYQERKANEATVTYDGTVYRQRKNLTSILLMGIDHDSGETGGQADFLQLIVIDDTSRTLKRLSIDRDTMTPITVLGVLGNRSGVRTAQVSLSHGFGDGKEQSCELTAEAVSNLLLGMPVDFYLAMNLDGIAALNDMAGGVTVTLADDFSAQDPAMAQGATLTLHGDQAEIYVRSRRNVGVGTNEARMVRQEQYVAKLFAQLDTQMRSDQSFSGTMFDTLSPYLTTSIGRGRLINVVWLAKDYARQEPLSISGEHRVGSDGFMQFYADEASLYETVLDLFYEEVK